MAYEKRFGSRASSAQPRYDQRMLPGTRVRYSGKWLANTGQRSGPAGQKRFWVCACRCACCASGRFVCTTELSPTADSYTPEELAADPAPRYLHIARENLVIVGKPSVRDDP